MSTLLTLFGGLAAVLVLYALGGFIPGLSPRLASTARAFTSVVAAESGGSSEFSAAMPT